MEAPRALRFSERAASPILGAPLAPGAHAELGARRAPIGNNEGPVCTQPLPGALPGSSTETRTRRAWHSPKSPKVGEGLGTL